MSGILVKYNCRILPFGIWASVAIACGIALNVMYVLIYFDAPEMLSTVALVGLIALIIYLLMSEATFTITDKTIERNLSSKSALFRKNSNKIYTWNDIKSYKSGTDKGRYRGEYQFVTIYFKNGDTWEFNDNYGEQSIAFGAFLTVFLEKTKQHNEQAQRSKQEATASIHTEVPVLEIERKKTFYETIFAKILTIVFIVFIVAIYVYGKNYMSATSYFKLYIILIPGVAYMYYRTFLSSKK